jgi:hypothetical protein
MMMESMIAFTLGILPNFALVMFVLSVLFFFVFFSSIFQGNFDDAVSNGMISSAIIGLLSAILLQLTSS